MIESIVQDQSLIEVRPGAVVISCDVIGVLSQILKQWRQRLVIGGKYIRNCEQQDDCDDYCRYVNANSRYSFPPVVLRACII